MTPQKGCTRSYCCLFLTLFTKIAAKLDAAVSELEPELKLVDS